MKLVGGGKVNNIGPAEKNDANVGKYHLYIRPAFNTLYFEKLISQQDDIYLYKTTNI